jgi:hypothetical protein
MRLHWFGHAATTLLVAAHVVLSIAASIVAIVAIVAITAIAAIALLLRVVLKEGSYAYGSRNEVFHAICIIFFLGKNFVNRER